MWGECPVGRNRKDAIQKGTATWLKNLSFPDLVVGKRDDGKSFSGHVITGRGVEKRFSDHVRNHKNT
jgi:hypothetical protein